MCPVLSFRFLTWEGPGPCCSLDVFRLGWGVGGEGMWGVSGEGVWGVGVATGGERLVSRLSRAPCQY